MPEGKPHVLMMGQTPPPWHGQAVATQILFDHGWEGFEVTRLRMEFSGELLEVGRFQWKKIAHLWRLIREARKVLRRHPGSILFYPPASAKWVPFLRDVVFLNAVRPLAGRTVFIFHASGLPVFAEAGWLRSLLARSAYHGADVSLEVAQEAVPPHRVFEAWSWHWCPCGIEVPPLPARTGRKGPLTLLFVGSLQEGKGVLDVLRTADHLKRRGRAGEVRFRIVGRWFSAEFEKEAREMHRELGLEDLVEFVGELTGEAKWQAYREADVFFFPTHYASEATPIVIMEALGMGLPVLSTEWAGIPAMLRGCRTATLLPVEAPELYAARIEGYLDEAGADGASSRSFYEEHYLPERFVERVEAALHEAAAGRAREGRRGRPVLRLQAYLADQNPKLGRSLGISRMTEVVLEAIAGRDDVRLGAVVSKSSIPAPGGASQVTTVPWSTRSSLMRVITDNLHPLVAVPVRRPDVWYFPKGFMPRFHGGCGPAVATIHDTIIQYYQDHYPEWRTEAEYAYWASMLRNTLTHAREVMTVSVHAKGQIEDFIRRHQLPEREIHVTYEPCLYEDLPQPESPAKADYVLHLGSYEPHKRTAWLIRKWERAAVSGKRVPKLHVVGKVPPEVEEMVHRSRSVVYLPFLEDQALVSQFTAAKALIFPSEVEGFGLPAIEAYYLGTPVCFTAGTSVEEVLGVATAKGGFDLDSPESFWRAVDEVLAMPAGEVRDCGLKLREAYDSRKVVERMMEVFRKAAEWREPVRGDF